MGQGNGLQSLPSGNNHVGPRLQGQCAAIAKLQRAALGTRQYSIASLCLIGIGNFPAIAMDLQVAGRYG